MSDWNDLLDRLTHPLRMDPELRREISRELLGHLEDSKAQFLDAGMTESDARAAAMKAMGDEKEVAEQLWQANRRRVRVRRAVKWAAGVTLMPASAAIAVSMAWGAIVSIAMLLGTTGGVAGFMSSSISDRFSRHAVAELPADARAVLSDGRDSHEQVIASAKTLADAHPNDPLYYANYAKQCLSDVIVHDRARQLIDRAKAKQVLAVLDRGKQVEPDNGSYPLVKAALLFEASSRNLEEVPVKSLPGFDYVNAAGKHDWWAISAYQVNDPAQFELALAEVHEAAGKPYIDGHSTDLVEQSLALLAPPRTLAEEVWRREHLAGVPLPYSRFYEIAPALSRAAELARHGQVDRAKEMVRDCRRIAISIAGRAQLVYDLMVARRMYALTLGTEALIDQQTGDTAGFERALASLREEDAFFNRLWHERRTLANRRMSSDRAGMADRYFLASKAPEFADFAPGRRAEYAVADRLALSALLIILTGLAAVAGARACALRIKTGRWPAIAFMGWRRLAEVVLVSCVLPVALYAIYTLSPLSGRERAADNSVERLAIEYAAVACAVLALLRTLSDRALRKRAAELGAEELKRRGPGKFRITAGIVLAIAVVIFLAHTRNGGLHARIQWLFPLLGVGLIGYLLTWLPVTARESVGAVQSPRRRLPPAAAWAVMTGLVFTAIWMLFSYPLSRDFEGLIRGTAILTCAAVALILLARGALAFRRDGAAWADQSFDYRLSMAPAVLLGAMGLALVGGLPLEWEERRAVAAMAANGIARSLSHELDQSHWQALKERLQAKAIDL
jgi:hypothetical protein